MNDELARLGVATVYEAVGRRGLVDADLTQIVPGSRAAGPARTVHCGQGDNLAVHAAMAELEPRRPQNPKTPYIYILSSNSSICVFGINCIMKHKSKNSFLLSK